MTVSLPPARFEHVRHRDQVSVYVHGAIDLCARDELRVALDAAIALQRSVVYVDLADATFMDSSGMHELARARRQVAARRGRFVLVTPSPLVRLLIAVWGNTDRFEVQDRSRDLDRAI